jgi:hypothetical protein
MWALNNSMLPNRATCHVMALGGALGRWVEPWVVESLGKPLGQPLGFVSGFPSSSLGPYLALLGHWVYYYLGALGLGLGPCRVI